MLTNHQLLQRAQKETFELEGQLETVNRQDFQLSMLKGRTDIRNFDEYHRQRREFAADRARLEMNIRRLKGYQVILEARLEKERAVKGLVAA